MPQARIVALLRRAGIAVDDIARFFGDPDATRLDRWDLEIVNTSVSWRQALAEARAALALDPLAARRFVTATATHMGGRDTNQDSALASDRLFAVADGIGGLDHGEVASLLAVETLDVAFAADRTVSGLLKACREANHVVWRQDATMGTTLMAETEPRAAADTLVANAVARGADDNVTALVVDVR